jgi:putative two-component system hydrogenase maturation factor HypX/HoxX
MGAREATAIGFIDACFGDSVATFERAVAERVGELSRRADFWQLLGKKHQRRLSDERTKPLAQYRTEELQQMYVNFFGADAAYHRARQRFVYKTMLPKSNIERSVTSQIVVKTEAVI